ncbi:hypothetical protein CspHIS471_0507910 [Cutaneotrichosporon sp. HIS471]|nr:hypothetical protein CspHIS471_0507910 [Cutaneotrichosporon sp. HIS471]
MLPKQPHSYLFQDPNGNDDADGEGDPGDEAAAVNVSCGSLGEEAHSNQTISTEGSSCIAVALINESEDVHTESSNFDGTFEMSPEVEHAIDDDLRAFEELLTAAASNAIPDDPVTPPASVPVEEWTKIPSHNDIATSPSCLPTFIPASLASTPFEVSAPKSDKQLGRDIVHMWASFQKSLNPITRFDPSLPANRESPMTSNLEPFSCEHVQRLHCDASRFRSAVESAVCSPSFERYAAVNLLMLWQGLEYCLPKEVGSVASQIVPLLRREERLVSGVVSDIAVWCEGRAD